MGDDDRIISLQRSCDRLWSERKMDGIKMSQFEATVDSISKELHDMRNNEQAKALERVSMKNTLERIETKVDSQSIVFKEHVREEMLAYGKIRKAVVVIGIALVAVIVDDQAGTNMIASIWKFLLNHLFGLI